MVRGVCLLLGLLLVCVTAWEEDTVPLDPQLYVFNESATSLCAPPTGCNFTSPYIWYGGSPMNTSVTLEIYIGPSSYIELYLDGTTTINVSMFEVNNCGLFLREESVVNVVDLYVASSSSFVVQDSANLTIYANISVDGTSTFAMYNNSNTYVSNAIFGGPVLADPSTTFECSDCIFTGEVLSVISTRSSVSNLQVSSGARVRFLGGLKSDFVGVSNSSHVFIEYDCYDRVSLFVDGQSLIDVSYANRSIFFFAQDSAYGNGTISISSNSVGFVSGGNDIAQFDGTIYIRGATTTTVTFDSMRIANLLFLDMAANVTIEALSAEFAQQQLNIPGEIIIPDSQVVQFDGDVQLSGCVTASRSVVNIGSTLTCSAGSFYTSYSLINLGGNIKAPSYAFLGHSTLNVISPSISINGTVSFQDTSDFVTSNSLNVYGTLSLGPETTLQLSNLTNTTTIFVDGPVYISGFLSYTLSDYSAYGGSYVVLRSTQPISGQFSQVTDGTGAQSLNVLYNNNQISLQLPSVPPSKTDNDERAREVEIALGVIGIFILGCLLVVFLVRRRRRQLGYQKIN